MEQQAPVIRSVASRHDGVCDMLVPAMKNDRPLLRRYAVAHVTERRVVGRPESGTLIQFRAACTLSVTNGLWRVKKVRHFAS